MAAAAAQAASALRTQTWRWGQMAAVQGSIFGSSLHQERVSSPSSPAEGLHDLVTRGMRSSLFFIAFFLHLTLHSPNAALASLPLLHSQRAAAILAVRRHMQILPKISDQIREIHDNTDQRLGTSKVHHRFWLGRRIWDVAKQHMVLLALHMGLAVTPVYPMLQFSLFDPSSSSGRGKTCPEQEMHDSWEVLTGLVLNTARESPRAVPTSPSLPSALPCTFPRDMGLSAAAKASADRRWGCNQFGFVMR